MKILDKEITFYGLLPLIVIALVFTGIKYFFGFETMVLCGLVVIIKELIKE